MNIQKSLKSLLSDANVMNRFNQILGEKAQGFISSVMQVVNNNTMLSTAEPQSVLNAAVVAATLDLPIDPNLGFAAIIPFKDNKTGIVKAQFQIMYKGFKQLAYRSGQVIKLNACPIYEGQLVKEDPLWGEYEFDFSKKTSSNIIGWAAAIELKNGFKKIIYKDIDFFISHGKKYSQSFKKGYGLWVDGFDSMCEKTIMKLLLSKDSPLSIEMQTAIKADQSVIREIGENNTIDVDYADNTETKELSHSDLEEIQRIMSFIQKSKTVEELEMLKEHCTTPELTELYEKQLLTLKN
jgi:recombination protein RecT